MKISTTKTNQIKNFCHQNRIEFFIVFGSYAQGRARPSSDIDIAINVKNAFEKVDKLELIFRLGDIFDEAIDLVVLTPFTEPLLKYEIFFKSTPVFINDWDYFVERKILAWKIYNDTQKFRDLRKQYVESYIRELKNESSYTD